MGRGKRITWDKVIVVIVATLECILQPQSTTTTPLLQFAKNYIVYDTLFAKGYTKPPCTYHIH